MIIQTILITMLTANSYKLGPVPQPKMNVEYPLSSTILNDSTMKKVLSFYEVPFPDIVLSQAKLESGNFTSRICRVYNNPFGLYNSKAKDYYKFRNWIEAVLFYRDNISIKYKGGSYYRFLVEESYAEDTEYVNKLKQFT